MKEGRRESRSRNIQITSVFALNVLLCRVEWINSDGSPTRCSLHRRAAPLQCSLQQLVPSCRTVSSTFTVEEFKVNFCFCWEEKSNFCRFVTVNCVLSQTDCIELPTWLHSVTDWLSLVVTIILVELHLRWDAPSVVSAGSEWTFAPISPTSGINFPAARPDREAEA